MDLQPYIELRELLRWCAELLLFGALGLAFALRWRLAPMAALGAIAAVAVRRIPEVRRSADPSVGVPLYASLIVALVLVAVGARRSLKRAAI